MSWMIVLLLVRTIIKDVITVITAVKSGDTKSLEDEV